MSEESNYYVYTYKEAGKIFYVGKGRNGRATAHIAESGRENVQLNIVAGSLSEDIALRLEAAMIWALPNLENKVSPELGSVIVLPYSCEDCSRYSFREYPIAEPSGHTAAPTLLLSPMTPLIRRKDTVRAQVKALVANGEPVNVNVVSKLTNIPYTTVARYIREINKKQGI